MSSQLPGQSGCLLYQYPDGTEQSKFCEVVGRHLIFHNGNTADSRCEEVIPLEGCKTESSMVNDRLVVDLYVAPQFGEDVRHRFICTSIVESLNWCGILTQKRITAPHCFSDCSSSSAPSTEVMRRKRAAAIHKTDQDSKTSANVVRCSNALKPSDSLPNVKLLVAEDGGGQGTDTQATDNDGTDIQATDNDGTDTQATDNDGTDTQATDNGGDDDCLRVNDSHFQHTPACLPSRSENHLIGNDLNDTFLSRLSPLFSRKQLLRSSTALVTGGKAELRKKELITGDYVFLVRCEMKREIPVVVECSILGSQDSGQSTEEAKAGTTIDFQTPLSLSSKLKGDTGVQFTVHHVIPGEPKVLIGQAISAFDALVQAPHISFPFFDKEKPGTPIRHNLVIINIKHHNHFLKSPGGAGSQEYSAHSLSASCHDELSHAFDCIGPFRWVAAGKRTDVSYKLSSTMSVQERMAESSLTWQLPPLFLALFRTHLQALLNRVNSLPELHPSLESQRAELQGTISFQLTQYNWQKVLARAVLAKGTPSFKASTDKANKEMEFVPTNLHIQRLHVDRDGETKHLLQSTSLSSISDAEESPSAVNSSLKRKAMQFLKRSSSSSNLVQEGTSCPAVHDESELKGCDVRKPEDSACVNKVFTSLAPQLTIGSLEMVTLGISAAHTLRFKCGGLHRLLAACNATHVKNVEALHKQIRDVEKLKVHVPKLRQQLLDAVTSADLTSISSLLVTVRDVIGVCALLQQGVSQSSDELAAECAVNSFERENIGDIQERFDNVLMSVLGGDIVGTLLSNSDSRDIIITKTDTFFDTWLGCLREIDQSISYSLIRLYRDSPALIAGQGSIVHRRHIVISQALSGIATGILSTLQRTDQCKPFYTQVVLNQGFLVVWTSLLSSYGDELGMLEDLAEVMDLLNNATFELCEGADMDIAVGGSMQCISVRFTFPKKLCSRMHAELLGQQLPIALCLFSQGVNENQVKADWLGTSKFQDEVNQANAERLSRYSSRFLDNLEWYCSMGNQTNPMSTKLIKKQVATYMVMLETAVKSKKERNIDILVCANHVCRFFDGTCLVSCKSGKDRTSMMTTLESGCYLVNHFQMPIDKLPSCLSLMRSTGTRIQNAKKNIGEARFAFNNVQLQCFPKLLRPPEGTFGASLT